MLVPVSDVVLVTYYNFALCFCLQFSSYLTIDVPFFTRSRFVDVTEIISAILAMFCGIAYIVTIVVGKSDYFLVVLAAGMFTVFRGIRNIIKSVRVGCFITNRVKRTTIIAPEPPQKERNIIIPKPLQQTQENVAAQNMQVGDLYFRSVSQVYACFTLV